MLNKLKQTTFFSGAIDSIATIDAYKIKNSSVINLPSSITDILDSVPIFKALKAQGTPGGISELKAASDQLDSLKGLTIDKDSLLKGIISTNSELLSGLKSLPNDLQEKLLQVNTSLKPISDTYNSVNGTIKEANNIIATVGSVSKKIINANLETLNGLGTMLNSLACDKRSPIIFEDVAGTANLISNLIRECSKLKIPNAFTGITKCIQDYKMLRTIDKSLMNHVIKNSDTQLLAQMSLGKAAREMISHTPNVINDFASNYTKPVFATTQEITQEFNTIKDSFSNINPSWNTCRASDADLSLNTNVLNNASKDFKYIATVATTSEYSPISSNNAIGTSDTKYMLLADSFGNNSAVQSIKKDSPLLVLTA